MTDEEVQRAAVLWLEGFDSLHIAQLVGISESVVYNNLRRIRSCILAPWRGVA